MSDSAFWHFSLNFYAQPGVSTGCLDLQEHAGADVNVLLFLLFLARQGRLVNGEEVARIDRFVESWRKQVVQPLRILRRKLKNGIEPFDAVATEKLRTEVKRIELHAERIEQETIEHLATAAALGVPAPSGIAAARANLAAYGKLLGALPEEPVRILIEAFSRPQGTLNSDQNNQA